MDVYLLIWLGILIIFVSGFIQGLTAFGFALISMPLLTVFLPLQQVVPIIVILSLFTNLVIWYDTRKYIKLKKYWILIFASMIAAPIGAYLLIFLNPSLLKVFVGILIVLFSLAILKGVTFKTQNERLSFVLVGFVSGILNGSVSISGPPVALFLSNQGVDKQTFKANLNIYAIILNVFTVSLFIYNGLLSKEVIKYISWMIPSVLLGVALGIKAVKKLNEVTFKKFALWLIIISGIWTFLSGVGLV